MDLRRGLNKEKLRALRGFLRSRTASHSERKALVIKCAFGFELEGKRKSAVTFVTALFLFSSGDTNIPKAMLFGMDVKGGLTMKSSDHFVIFFILVLLLTLKEKRLNEERETE